MDVRYFDDFTIGESFETAAYTVTAAEIIAFAKQFDPQPMHTDPEAAKSLTGGLIASGFHTISLTMRLFVMDRHYKTPPGTLGAGIKNIKWLKPVRPGDTLHVKIEIVDLKPSETKPDRGAVSVRLTTFNQHGEPVQEMTNTAIFAKRPI
jgi:acyl dehydratase